MGLVAIGGPCGQPTVWDTPGRPEQRGASLHDGLQAGSTDHHLPDKQAHTQGGCMKRAVCHTQGRWLKLGSNNKMT